MTAIVIIVSIFFVLNIVLWILVIKKIRKEFSGQGALVETRQEINKLIMEISRITEQNVTLIDEKCNELKKISDETEKRIMIYKNIVSQTEIEEKPKKHLTTQKKALEAYSKKTEKSEPIEELQQSFDFSEKSPEKPLENNVFDFSKVQTEKTGEKTEKPINEQILELANMGAESEFIASKLNISISQVDFVLNVFGKK